MNIYKSCCELPLKNFIKIVVTDDLSWLYINPEPGQVQGQDLEPIWNAIIEEYSKASGSNPESQYMFSLLKQMAILDNKIQIIQNIVTILSDKRTLDKDSGTLIAILRSFGFTYAYSESSFKNDLRLTVSSSKRFVIDYKGLSKDLATLQDSIKGKTEESDYYKLIAHLSKFLQFKIDVNTTTVIEYLSYLEMYNSQHTR